jgi:hypothetical protein
MDDKPPSSWEPFLELRKSYTLTGKTPQNA